MRKLFFLIASSFLLALIFAPSTYAVTGIQKINPELQIYAPTNTPTPTPTIALKVAPKIKGTFSGVTGTPTNTPTPTVNPTGTINPTPTSEITSENVTAVPTEPELAGVSKEKEVEKKLDQKEIIGIILIGILIVIIVIQALWDKIKKPPTATSSEPE